MKPNKTHTDLYVCLIFFILAISIRAYRINNFELWFDEAFTYYEMVSTEFINSLLKEYSPPFYYVILRVWGKIAGYSETVIRMPSAIFGGLFVSTTYLLAKTLFDKKTGIWCGVIALLSPIHIYYSQEARGYSLFLLLIIMTYLMVWKAQQTNRLLYWLLSSVCACMTLYTHTLAIIPVFSTVAFIVYSNNNSHKLIYKWLLFILMIPVIIFLPWVIFSVFMTEHSAAESGWMKYIWDNTPAYLAIPMSLDAFSYLTSSHVFNVKVGNLISYNNFLGNGVKYIVRIFLAFLIIGNMLPYYDKYISSSETTKNKNMLYFALFFPLAMLLIISTVKPLYVISRYDLIAYPAFVILIGLAFSKIQSIAKVIWNPLLLLAIALWFIPMVIFIYYYVNIPRISRNSSRALAIKSIAANDDIVVFTGENAFPQLYYLDRYGVTCRNWRCVDNDTAMEFSYRYFPLANEKSSGAYNHAAYLNDQQQKVASEWDQIVNMRKSTTSNIYINFDARLIGGNIKYKYQLDQMLMNSIRDSNATIQLVSEVFPIIQCKVLPR